MFLFAAVIAPLYSVAPSLLHFLRLINFFICQHGVNGKIRVTKKAHIIVTNYGD